MKRLAFILLLAITPAVAQDASQLTDNQKIAILKRAYQLNGNSMVGWGSIDLSKDPIAQSVQTVQCYEHKTANGRSSYFDCPQSNKP